MVKLNPKKSVLRICYGFMSKYDHFCPFMSLVTISLKPNKKGSCLIFNNLGNPLLRDSKSDALSI